MTFRMPLTIQKASCLKEDPAMSIPFKTEIGIVYLAMAINCSEYKAKKADDGKSYEEIKCIAKTVNHKCANCT